MLLKKEHMKTQTCGTIESLAYVLTELFSLQELTKTKCFSKVISFLVSASFNAVKLSVSKKSLNEEFKFK